VKDKSLIVIAVVVILAGVAFATGFKRVANSESQFLRSVHWRADADSEPQPVQSDPRERVEPGAAQAVDITVEQAAGDLVISGDATTLMDAAFESEPDSFKPKVGYSVEGTAGTLTVVQPEISGLPVGETVNDWNMSFGTTLPIDLDIKRGAGTAEMRFGSLDIRSLRYLSGAGESTIDFTGLTIGERSVPARIESGVGSLDLVVPQSIPVRVTVEQALGDLDMGSLHIEDGAWVNDAYRSGMPALEVDIVAGAGSIMVRGE
jgi:hypothetical protein